MDSSRNSSTHRTTFLTPPQSHPSRQPRENGKKMICADEYFGCYRPVFMAELVWYDEASMD